MIASGHGDGDGNGRDGNARTHGEPQPVVGLRVRMEQGAQSRRVLGGVDLLGDFLVGVGVIDVVAHLVDGRASHGELLGNSGTNAFVGAQVAKRWRQMRL